MREPRPPEAHELPEAETIQLAQRGDAAAFESLYRSHCARVFALCTRMLKNAAEAEDLTQEIFLHVFRKIHSFRGESAFSTWLYRVSVNMVLMRLRRMTFAKTSLDDIAEAGETTGASQRELAGQTCTWKATSIAQLSRRLSISCLRDLKRCLSFMTSKATHTARSPKS